MVFYKILINACNTTADQILKNEVELILLKNYTEHRNKRLILGTIISGFIGLAFEGISSFLHHKGTMPSKEQLKLCPFQWMHQEINLCI